MNILSSCQDLPWIKIKDGIRKSRPTGKNDRTPWEKPPISTNESDLLKKDINENRTT
jgi:hypothetical protein